MKISRRTLMTTGALALTPGLALAQPSARRTVLVTIFLRGGMDGLSLAVPHGDAAYYAARRSTAIAKPGKPGGAIDLDGHFGLHPRLGALEPAYRAGELAVVHAVGSSHGTRSHFEAQDYAETATPGVRSTRTGWLARCLTDVGKPTSPLGVVALSDKRPLALRGEVDVITAKRLEAFRLRVPKRLESRLGNAFRVLYAEGDDSVIAAGRGALEAERRLAAVEVRAADYPEGARPLADVVALVRADVGLRVAWIDAGGWDTHQAQGGADSGRLARGFDALGKGLAAFRTDLGPDLERVVVLVMTEFGRTVAENGTGGTDHGHGSAMLLWGGPVRGGKVHGQWPGLSAAERFEGRDLAVTTDYRDVLAEVAEKHLGARDRARVVPGHTLRALGLLR
jgi:uncharacterized protein (DUF1501 family)